MVKYPLQQNISKYLRTQKIFDPKVASHKRNFLKRKPELLFYEMFDHCILWVTYYCGSVQVSWITHQNQWWSLATSAEKWIRIGSQCSIVNLRHKLAAVSFGDALLATGSQMGNHRHPVAVKRNWWKADGEIRTRSGETVYLYSPIPRSRGNKATGRNWSRNQ